MASQFVSKSRRLLGVRRQQWIRGFFGTSALISSVVIFLISIFLVWEAVRFFPAHRAELRLSRRSGQEKVDYLIRETAWSQQV
jgi:phosphate transport system permease protein